MTQPVLLGGLFIGVLSALPIVNVGNCCCLWIIGGGMLAAYLLQQNDPRPLTFGRGAWAGGMAGVVSAGVWLIASILLDMIIGPLQQRMAEALLRSSSEIPGDARVWLEVVANGDSASFRFALGFLFHLFVGGAFSSIGGILGVAMFRREPPVAASAAVIPPPLPPA